MKFDRVRLGEIILILLSDRSTRRTLTISESVLPISFAAKHRTFWQKGLTKPLTLAGVCRDDLVFVVFLYQRWIYRIDPTRVNEFGCAPDLPLPLTHTAWQPRSHFQVIHMVCTLS